MKKYKSFYLRIVVALLSMIICAFAFIGADVEPTQNFYVNDYADILSADLENHIISESKQLNEKTKAQVVVLTVKNLGGKDIKDYGLEVGRDWGIGDKEKNNGVLLLVSLEDRKVRIEVGRGLEGRLTDTKTGNLIRTYAKEDYGKDDFESGTAKLYDAIVSEVYIEYDMEPIEGYDEAKASAESEDDEGMLYTVLIFVFLGVFLWLVGTIGGNIYRFVAYHIFGKEIKKKTRSSHDHWDDNDRWGGWGDSGGGDCGGGGDFGGGGSDSDF